MAMTRQLNRLQSSNGDDKIFENFFWVRWGSSDSLITMISFVGSYVYGLNPYFLPPHYWAIQKKVIDQENKFGLTRYNFLCIFPFIKFSFLSLVVMPKNKRNKQTN